MVTFTGEDPPLVSHSAHPEHALKLVATGGQQWLCDGCKQQGQPGQERRYRCEGCDFDLHVFCAQAPARFEHPMLEGSALTFFGNRDLCYGIQPDHVTLCNICGTQVLGFLYHNREHGVDLHPFCANLPKRVVADDGGVVDLVKAAGHDCGRCGMDGYRGHFLAYRYQDDDGELVYLHIACIMEGNSSDDDVVQLSSTSTTAGEVSDRTLVTTLANAPRRRGKFRNFCKIAYRVVMFSHSVATMNPVGVIAAFASPI